MAETVDKPFVSVVIPVLNEADFIERAVCCKAIQKLRNPPDMILK